MAENPNLEKIVEDIKSVKIQGATNVAIATFDGIKAYLSNYVPGSSYEVFMADVEKAGTALAYARPNEPLAKNGLRYIMYRLHTEFPQNTDVKIAKDAIHSFCDEYLELIKGAKDKIVKNAADVLGGATGVLTHCHSSTAEKIIIEQAKKHPELKVVCTETRPLFQGRITAVNLLQNDLDVTLIADSTAESFISGRGSFPVEAILIGSDEITMQGDMINKIGSWGVALAGYFTSKPVYCVSSILKTEVSTIYKPVQIEMRGAKEIWPDAPANLKMVNPSFELVDKEFITGFITEVGVIRPQDIQSEISKGYPWMLN